MFSSRQSLLNIQHIITLRTVVCGVQALEGVAIDSEEGERVPVAAEELQPTKTLNIQLL